MEMEARLNGFIFIFESRRVRKNYLFSQFKSSIFFLCTNQRSRKWDAVYNQTDYMLYDGKNGLGSHYNDPAIRKKDNNSSTIENVDS